MVKAGGIFLYEKRRHWKEQLVTALELPGDLAYRDAIVTVTGQNQAVVENYRCILRFIHRRRSFSNALRKSDDQRQMPGNPLLYASGNDDKRKNLPCCAGKYRAWKSRARPGQEVVSWKNFCFFFHGYVVLSVHGSQLERF